MVKVIGGFRPKLRAHTSWLVVFVSLSRAGEVAGASGAEMWAVWGEAVVEGAEIRRFKAARTSKSGQGCGKELCGYVARGDVGSCGEWPWWWSERENIRIINLLPQRYASGDASSRRCHCRFRGPSRGTTWSERKKSPQFEVVDVVAVQIMKGYRLQVREHPRRVVFDVPEGQEFMNLSSYAAQAHTEDGLNISNALFRRVLGEQVKL
ncbi:hypothetical protein DFH07DRAFT_784559 [Mycena maculata]|uniref:Uncharacterized protein n=1 Tax=Mycena maculata TaxID=230809 RepID=A0AAD7HGR4_9AGAR|nr:hypothetical protein DFH07DRAFT_784559 [Mycena maculata]